MIMMSGSLMCFNAFWYVLMFCQALVTTWFPLVSGTHRPRNVVCQIQLEGLAWLDKIQALNVQLESARCLGASWGYVSGTGFFPYFSGDSWVFSLVFLCDCGVGCVCSFTYHGKSMRFAPQIWSQTASEKRFWIHTRCNNGQEQHVMPLRS